MEASKIREEQDKQYCRYEKYIDRLEAKAGKQLDVPEGAVEGDPSSFFFVSDTLLSQTNPPISRICLTNWNILIRLSKSFPR